MQANYMKRCYEKDATGYRITMDFTVDIKANLAIWHIYLHLSGDSILLDKCVGEFYKEDILYDAELSEHLIIGDVIVVNQDIFIMMTRLGKICLMKYRVLQAEKQAIQSVNYIEMDRRAAFNLGPLHFTAAFRQFSQNELWVTWNRYKLLRFDCLMDKGFRVYFDEEVEKASGALPDDLDGRPVEIATEFKRILNYKPNKNTDKIQYIGYLHESNVLITMKHWGGKRGDGITYFFYKKDIKQPLKVIRYDNYNKVWLLSGYKEKEIPKNRFVDEFEYKDIN